jgi:hypothetical protein
LVGDPKARVDRCADDASRLGASSISAP